MKILKFTDFSKIYEADEFGMGVDPNAAPAAAPEPKKYTFVFIDADKPWAAEYPTGGGIKKYKRYEVTEENLTKWIEESKLTERADDIKAALTGEKDFEKSEFYRFKQALRDKTLDYKELGELDVEYGDDMTPYTGNLDVTFLKAHKEKKAEAHKKEEQTDSPETDDNSQEVQ